MQQYIALLRGINVGGKNTLPMNELVKILEKLGAENVKTYIQSGNAVFQYPADKNRITATEIESGIEKTYGLHIKVFLLQKSDFLKAVNRIPFSCREGKALHLYFLYSPALSPDLQKLQSVQAKTEQFQLIENIFYLYAPEGIGRSKILPRIEPALGVEVTGRNYNTIQKLKAMLS